MRKLVNDTDLGIPYTTPINKAIVNSAKSLLGINKLNELYDSVSEFDGIEFASAVLNRLGTRADISAASMENIPVDGPFILIANHPHGALDGLLFIDTVLKKRPDAKFLGNFLLSRIEPLSRYFIEVNPFESKSSRNISGIRKALDHIKNNGPLIIFPAGEVSTYQKRFTRLQDREWSASMMKLIRNAQVPVIPAFIYGTNSKKFHLAGKIHPALRTVRLPLELLNKKGKTIPIEIGTPLMPKRLADLPSIKSYSDYLRTNVYCLRTRILEENEKIKKPDVSGAIAENALSAGPIEGLPDEIRSLGTEYRLFTNNNLELYCAPSDKIPLTLKEIGRLREITFREIGEGTNSESDTDRFDDSYDHLFIWDTEYGKLVGAYRLGYGDQLIEKHGIEGFYTYSLFEFSPKFNAVLKQTVELGRSFIVKEYQRKAQPLMLLWKGIFLILMKKPQYRYLMGAVSISGDYSAGAKWLITTYINLKHWDKTMASYVVPRNGISMKGTIKIYREQLSSIANMEMLDKLIYDVDHAHTGMPVLLKRYLQLNGKVLAFNIDPDFNNSLDALMLVDLEDIPRDILDILSKEMNSEEVYARFSKKGQTDVPRETMQIE